MVDPITLSMAVIALLGSIVTGIMTILNNSNGPSCCTGLSPKTSCLHHCLNSQCCVNYEE